MGGVHGGYEEIQEQGGWEMGRIHGGCEKIQERQAGGPVQRCSLQNKQTGLGNHASRMEPGKSKGEGEGSWLLLSHGVES